MKKKLLIINKSQFGTLTDSYKWCENLRADYDITFICFDTGNPKVCLDGVNVKYVSYNGNYTLRGIKFILFSIINILLFSGKIVVVYFEQCKYLKQIIPFKKMLLDIRTLSISRSEGKRKLYNDQIISTCKCFDVVSVISEGVKQKINIRNKPVFVLPLGADVISAVPKNYDRLRLLYVGTLTGRDIDKTIIGLSYFIKKYSNFDISYDIVGDGYKNELFELKQLVASLELEHIVKFHGTIAHHELSSFFDLCNIGVSFVPITEYYEHQPPTKTFEYIFSGLFTIATSTLSNVSLINRENGIIINDTPESFCEALCFIRAHKSEFNEEYIRTSLLEYSWKNIVENNLKPILNIL